MKSVIWRVESEEGIGIYCYYQIINKKFYNFPKSTQQRLNKIYKDSITHNPEDDEILSSFWNDLSINDRKKYFFGFSNIHQFFKWFSYGYRKDMAKIGLKLRKYQINEKNIIHGKYQSIFFKDDDTIILEEYLPDL